MIGREFNFRESSPQSSLCFHEISPQLTKEVKEHFLDISFWLALAILSDNQNQYNQAWFNCEALSFSEDMADRGDDTLSNNIKVRLVDFEYIKDQIKEAQNELADSSNSINMQNSVNKEFWQIANYNLLCDSSLYSSKKIKTALAMMPCLNNPADLKHWSEYFQEDENRLDLSDMLEDRYHRFNDELLMN